MEERFQDLNIYKNPPGFRERSVFVVQLWRTTYALLFRPSPKFMWGFRRSLLTLFGAKVGRRAEFDPSCKITYPWLLETDEFCWVGDDTVIYNLAKITLGNHVALAHRVYLCCGNHEIDKVTFDIVADPIVIEDEVWIANDVFVAGGVTIGKGAVVGARSSVFKNIEGGYVYSGTPLAQKNRRVKS
jgi:putative colanic acid biosynthesis acetyltransferase WcaF